ncbi:MAG: DUF1800 domain-containing protein [Cyclobacteriaceae bacterium]
MHLSPVSDGLVTEKPKPTPDQINRFRKVKPVDLSSSLSKEAFSQTKNRALTAGLTTYAGSWEKADALHLLRRTLFGVKKSELDQFASLSFEEAVTAILNVSTTPNPPVNNYNNAAEGVEDPGVPFGDTWIEAPYGFDYEGQRVGSLKTWLIGNMINQEANITEKLILFWHNLLVTESWGIFIGRVSYQYFKVIRDHAFGNFKELIKQITIDPAMLYYLNGNSNVKESPDENYARELQELFCLGKGPNSQYTEGDVQAAARVLTGWAVKWQDVLDGGLVAPVFRPWNHDTSSKQFSSFYGDRLITGKTGDAGADELDELLDMIFDNNEVAFYICRRLYNFFVYSEIDEATEANVIKPLATIFRDNNYEIRPVLEALFRSEHFFDAQNRGVMLKNPADHLVGAWRTLEMQYDDPSDLHMVHKTHASMLWSMAGMGMEMADPPSVAGWPAYYQAPQFDKSWITTDTISSRALRIDSMIFWGFWVTPELQIKADLIGFIGQFTTPELPGPMLEEAAGLLLGLTLSDEAIGRLKAILLSGQSTDSYWTAAWYDHINDPTNEEYRLIIENRLKPTFQSMLQMGEFQLM